MEKTASVSFLNYIDMYKFTLIWICGSIIAGAVFDMILKKKLIKHVHDSKKNVFYMLAASFKGTLITFMFLFGFYMGVLNLELSSRVFDMITKSVSVIILILIYIVMNRFLSQSLKVYMSKIHSAIPQSLLDFTLKTIVFTIFLLTIFRLVGIPITPMLTALGVGGLAVALALQDTLANFFAGIHILVTRQINIGDFIEMSPDKKGEVVDINWRNTSIKTSKNSIIIVPNTSLSTATLINYDLLEKEIVFTVTLGVSYESDLEQVEKISIEVAKNILQQDEGGVKDFEPLVRYGKFSDFSIEMTVVMKSKTFGDQFRITHEFIKALHKRYADENITIPYPTRTVLNK